MLLNILVLKVEKLNIEKRLSLGETVFKVWAHPLGELVLFKE